MDIEEMIEKLKAEICFVEKQQNISAWSESELPWRVIAAHLIGKLSGLRFALDLLQGEEVDPKTFTVPKER